jgi:type III pantothenate kinase
MLLTLDIGNTNIALGLFEGDKCTRMWRLASDSRRTADEYAVLLQQALAITGVNLQDIAHTVIGSVVPVLSQTLDSALCRVAGEAPYHVTHESRMPVKNRYANRHEVGIDRLANASGGVLQYGAPLVVLDLGTAVTLDVISRNKEYLGGAILPGIELSASSLSRGTARLPLTAIAEPLAVIGKTTVESIRSGIVNGLVGAVDALLEGIWKELGYKTPTIATGGLAGIVTGRSRHVRREDPELTLVGLKRIWEMNVRTRRKPA